MRAISVFSFETGTSTRWCLAAAALRRRVRKSAMGSVCIVLLKGSYQLAFTTPGISPLSAIPRKQILHIWNLRIYPRARPQQRQRLRIRTLNFAFLSDLAIFAVRAILLCYPFFAKRKPERLEQLAALLIVLRACRHGDIHALDLVHARVIDLRKHQLVLQSQGVIPTAVERILRQAAEVANARKHHVAQAVEKFVHVVAAQSHCAADGHALANLEIRDG